MGLATTNDTLNRLLVIHSRSLLVYLLYAPPWWKDDNGRFGEALTELAHDQLELADRIGVLLVACGGTPAVGLFPDRFMAYHDLEFSFLLKELIAFEDRVVVVIERLLPSLSPVAEAQALAQEAIGMAKAHRDILADLQRDLVGTTAK
jgi:hypothetical protein